ncbi:MAG: squalene/phytoene synthase family protein [bacterium]
MEWQYCKEMLPKVSRTFALNIVKLKGKTCEAVTISYLLFRIADTFEDNLFLKGDEKIKALEQIRWIFEGDKGLNERLDLYESLKFQWKQSSYEKELVENGDKVLKCYFDLPPIYRSIIDPLISESVEGMAKFQKRKLDSSLKIYQLQDLKDLEEYCYYVAGIVGIMLTRIFSLKKSISKIKTQLEKYQVQFGLALQLTNILKDWQKDLNRGWCYLPSAITNKWQINLEDSISTNQQIGIIKDIIPWILTYFDSALRYIEIIPETERSIRLFCIIPFVLAYNTLIYLFKNEDKVPRKKVSEILEISNYFADSNQLLKKDYLRVKKYDLKFIVT